jgi:hypothetical protein
MELQVKVTLGVEVLAGGVQLTRHEQLIDMLKGVGFMLALQQMNISVSEEWLEQAN